MQEQGQTFQELIGTARRRVVPVAAVALAVLVIGVPIVLAWPAVFRSTATILIEEQEIPKEFVRSTVTTIADERIQVITQQVMTRSTLMQIVEKYDLYAKERRYLSNEEILDRMRRDIRTQTISVEGGSGNRLFGGGSRAIAFKVSYDNEAPQKAQQVANELVTLYLNENVRTRRQRADEATAFFADEAERIGKQITEIEAKLAAFKRANARRLPETTPLNLQLRERAEAELEEILRQQRLVEDRRIYLESQLTVLTEPAPIPPNQTVLEPEERLRMLRNQYASQAGIYGESHPDLVRMRREIESLEKISAKKPLADPKALEDAKSELARLEARYAADHPDVQRQQKRVAALQAEQGKLPARKPDNPAYVSLSAQIEAARAESESLQKRREDVRARIAGYEARLDQAPGVEQAYRDLMRDYDNALSKYKEIRAKQMEARVALELEKERKGERFSLIDPPQYPERPAQPDRRKLLATTVAGSVGAGIGAGFLAESLDRSVRGARALGALLDTPLLGVIPRVEDPERRRRR